MEKEIHKTVLALCRWIQTVLERNPTPEELAALPEVVKGVSELFKIQI